MGADVGVFQVADTPAYGYVYSIPLKGRVFSKTLVKGDCNTVDQPSKSENLASNAFNIKLWKLSLKLNSNLLGNQPVP